MFDNVAEVDCARPASDGAGPRENPVGEKVTHCDMTVGQCGVEEGLRTLYDVNEGYYAVLDCGGRGTWSGYTRDRCSSLEKLHV